MTLVFLILAVLTLAGAVAAITLRMLVHSVLALVISFSGLAALYIQLGAQFVGLAQILVYVGAVAILIVFAILLTRDPTGHLHLAAAPSSKSLLASGVVAAAVFAVLAWAVMASGTPAGMTGAVPPAPAVAVKQVGDALLTRFALPLEVIGLMLTAALIGAVILALEETQSTK